MIPVPSSYLPTHNFFFPLTHLFSFIATLLLFQSGFVFVMQGITQQALIFIPGN